MNQKNIDVINICLDMMETFGNEKSKADIREAKEALRGMVDQIEVLGDTVNMLSPLMMENRKLKEKQIPKKVTETYEIATNYARGRYGVCPNCGQDAITYNCDKYCWNCSQKLDWEGK